MTTNEYIRSVKQHGWPPFPGKLWQRNYYEHIVRNDADLARIRAYIRANPANWDVLRYGEPRFMIGYLNPDGMLACLLADMPGSLNAQR